MHEPSTVITPGGFTEDTFARMAAQRDEPDWLRRRRQDSWERFQGLELPSRSHEEWRRTDIRGLDLKEFAPPRTEAPPAVSGLSSLLGEGLSQLAGATTLCDGSDLGGHLDEALAQRGVLFGNIDRLVAQHGDRFEPYLLRRCVDPEYDKFAALHGAFWTGGTLLYVPRGVAISQPLSSLVALSAAGQADLSHVLLVLEEGASATLLHEAVSLDPEATGLHVGAVEVFLGPGAELRYVDLQNWAGNVWHFSHERMLLDRDAQLEWNVAVLGSRLAKVNQEVVLEKSGARAEMNGTLLATGRRHLSYHTRQHHAAPHTTSNLLYKGALEDRSRIVWRGMIRVDPAAQKTNAYQRNDNLVLSGTARADSIPGLEIEADDVRCTHGATAGRVDEDQVFYCMCRGLSRDDAIRLIVEGFFQGVLDRIGVEPVRENLGRAVVAGVEGESATREKNQGA